MKKKLIKIKTEKEFQDLLSQGYKVVNNYSRFGMSKDKKGGFKTDYNYGYIFLEKGDSKLTVDCSEISMLFASQYSQFADIDGNYFDRISDHTVKSDIECYTYDFFDERRKSCVYMNNIQSKNFQKIIVYLKAYVENEITLYLQNNLGKNLFNIFSNVFLIREINNQIDCDVLNKNQLTIQKINELRKNSKKIENCYLFSFFYFYSKSTKSKFHPDVFIGCIFYDLKNQKTVSFNLTSTYEEVEHDNNLKGAQLFIHCCRKIFEKSIEREYFLSIMHVSIIHTTYTPLPWIFFAALYSFENIFTNTKNRDYLINIPEFFIFGISKEFNTQESFYYENITKNRRGSAIIQFDLINDKKINYQLRFDVSKGEEFLHIDYGYYQNTMNKLLSHFPIDIETVTNFSKRLFVAIMSSGFYDPEFAGILKNKLKNTAEIVKKYKELSEPLKLIHNSDKIAQWLKDTKLIEEFQKICFNDKDIDMKKYYRISKEDSRLFTRDEKGIIRCTNAGLMVLVRLLTGDDPKLQLIENYLSKPNFS